MARTVVIDQRACMPTSGTENRARKTHAKIPGGSGCPAGHAVLSFSVQLCSHTLGMTLSNNESTVQTVAVPDETEHRHGPLPIQILPRQRGSCFRHVRNITCKSRRVPDRSVVATGEGKLTTSSNHLAAEDEMERTSRRSVRVLNDLNLKVKQRTH